MRERVFRVLVIDDSEEVLKRVGDNIPTKPVYPKGSSVKVRFEVKTLHVKLTAIGKNEKGRDNIFEISNDTIEKLGYYCSEPFEYIYSDFGYIGNRDINEDLRKQLTESRQQVSEGQIKGNLLQLRDIKTKFEKISYSEIINYELVRRIERNFIGHTGKVILYTNSPYPFNSYFSSESSLNMRKAEVREVFESAIILETENKWIIKMHEEFPIIPKIEEVFKDNPEGKKEYFAKLLGNYIKHNIEYDALEFLVESQQYLRYANAKNGAKKLVKWGLMLGAVSAVLGEAIYHLIERFTDFLERKYHLEFIHDFRWLFITIIFIIGILALLYVALKSAKMTEDIADVLSKAKEE
jgi:hypothetical protein